MSVKQNALAQMLGPTVVYHYCSQNVLESIVERGVLWAADLRSMNDPREVKGSVQVVEGYLESLDFADGSMSADLLKRLSPQFRSFNGFSRFFCSSFTYQDDDLYSWLNYGDRGQGFAIGFKKDYFPSFYWRDVTYNDSIFRQQIDAVWATAVREAAEGKKTIAESSVSAAIELQGLCVSNKHTSWSNEKEARLVLPILIDSHSDFDLEIVTDIVNDKKVYFKGSPNGIRPYVELGLKNPNERSILEITIGPRNETSREVLITFLLANGFENVRINQSTCEFR